MKVPVLTDPKSSFTPFITENLYQTLRRFLPPTNKDNRSIHFVDFPDVNEKYFDPEIERQVRRMQAIIELTRTLREKYQPSLKVRFVYILSSLTQLGNRYH
jgi:isoleucyl-tRNA synthetase